LGAVPRLFFDAGTVLKSADGLAELCDQAGFHPGLISIKVFSVPPFY